MRSLLVSALFSLSLLPAGAATIVDGYIISLKGDSAKCRIEVHGLDLFSGVTIIDTAGTRTTYKAKHKEIHGFGFDYHGQHYDYVLRTSDDGTLLFWMRKAMGRRYNLYYRFYSSSFYAGKSGEFVNDTESYMIEDTAGRVITWDGIFTNRYKKKMREFLHEDQRLIDLYNRKVDRINDIPSFVRAANEL